ncbi:MAG: DNA-directed RNA polymerase subunit A'', partial [Halobacteria archaeon]|nr:DNA-directed RNA polymerase subunit A'' [Halobacteria archaeon]
PDEILRIELASGREIRATKSHSFVTRDDNEVVPIRGDDLEIGDYLPVVAEFGVNEPTESIDLRNLLPMENYWSTSALTDGGASLKVGDKQARNRLETLDNGAITEDTAYPVGGTVGLPQEFPLDTTTGFFVGAWLAEGSLTDYYVSVSNVDEEFQEQVRDFARRFSLSVNEYENNSGFARGYDIRLNGKIVADLMGETCINDGDKAVPGFAFGAPDEFVSALLRGYFSGDGNVSKNAVRASSTSDELLRGIALLLARFGVYSTLKGDTIRIPRKFVPRFAERVGMVGQRVQKLHDLVGEIENDEDIPDFVDQIPNFGDTVDEIASELGIPSRQFNSATKRQHIGRMTLEHLVKRAEGMQEGDGEEAGVKTSSSVSPTALEELKRAIEGDVVWDKIEEIEAVETEYSYVYDFSVSGLETFTTSQGVVTHNTMNTFHYAGVAEIDVTQGLPRLIEIVDARKEPDTPMMTVYLKDEWATEREKAREVVWDIEATKILSLGDMSMVVSVDLDKEMLDERSLTIETIAEKIEKKLGVEVDVDDENHVVSFGPSEPSYRNLLQLVEKLREIVFKGIEGIDRVVIRKEQTGEDREEYVLYTEGSAFKKVLRVEGVDETRSRTNNIHEMENVLGIEAARNSIINETMSTLEEQGLDVDVRHIMLVADAMTMTGEIRSIGRHGISGSKGSVLSRAAFEVTVNHLLDAAVHGEIDDLNGVTENVIVGQPIKLGTGDVNLVMGKPE